MDLKKVPKLVNSSSAIWRKLDEWRKMHKNRNVFTKAVFAAFPYLVSLAMLAGAFALTDAFSILSKTPLLLPFAAIILAAVLNGLWPSLVCAISAMFIRDYFFIGAEYQLEITSRYIPPVLIFGLTAVIVSSAVERLKSAEAQVRHMALHDFLTGLPNRRLLEDRLAVTLERAKRNSTKFAVFFLDIDNFKQINDKHGHDAGDSFLRETAKRIQSSIRAEDSVARMGGDEFIILIDEIEKIEDAMVVAEKVNRSTCTPFQFLDEKLSITCCLGVAVYPDHGLSYLELLHNADQALYKAKASGKNKIELHNPELNYG